MDREQLYHHLKNDSRVFENERVEDAFRAVDRKDFIETDYESEAYEDYPVPLGHGAHIPQPTTTAFMFELLDIKEGEAVLVVGSGSGWSSAIASELTGREGSVDGTEIVHALADLSRHNLEKTGHAVTIHNATHEIGLPGKHFDKIIVFASAHELPQGLLQQLVIGGTIVIPIEGTLYKIVKTSDFEYDDQSFPGFTFQELVA